MAWHTSLDGVAVNRHLTLIARVRLIAEVIILSSLGPMTLIDVGGASGSHDPNCPKSREACPSLLIYSALARCVDMAIDQVRPDLRPRC
jgi:hypothetical protein